MKSSLSLVEQLRSSWLAILLVFAVSAAFISGVLILHIWKGISIGELTRDPVGFLGGSFYTGFLSQVGIFFWASSAAICLFSAHILSRSSNVHKLKNFLIASGLLTLLLGLDDALLLHEGFFPYCFGIPDKVVFVSYAGFILFYLIKFFPIILKTEYILLGMAIAFFGGSVALDVINLSGIDPYLFEDGTKFIGMVSWLVYFFRLGTSAVCHNTAQDVGPDRNLPQ